MAYVTSSLIEATERAYNEAEEYFAELRESERALERVKVEVRAAEETCSRSAQLSHTEGEIGEENDPSENLPPFYRDLLLKERKERIRERKKRLEEVLEGKKREKDLHQQTLRAKQETWKVKKAYAELMQRSLISSSLNGISGTKTRGSVFLRFCDERPLCELSDELRQGIEEVMISLTPISSSMRLKDYGYTGTEKSLTDCWNRLLNNMNFPHHIVRNTSCQKLFGSYDEKPDLSIVDLEAFKSHLVREVRAEMNHEGEMSSLEHLRDEEFNLLGWGPIDVVFELKTEISEHGKVLCGLGLQGASQAYHRLCCMRHFPFVVIADSNYMMFFHTSGTSVSTEWNTGCTPFWRRSPLVEIGEGLMYLRALLEVLHRDWCKENSPASKRIRMVKCVNSGLERFVSAGHPRIAEVLSVSAKHSGGANIFVLSGRQMNPVVAKVVCFTEKEGNIFVQKLDRERRRLLALNVENINGVPVLKSSERGEQRIQEGQLVQWKAKDEKKYYAIVFTPFAKGGTLKQQRHLLHNTKEGGFILCRIIRRVAKILCKAHNALNFEDHCAMHGDVKPSNIVLTKTVVECEDPEPLLIDWEHSMLLTEEPHSEKACTRKVGRKSPQKLRDSEAPGLDVNDPPDYVSVFTPAFCARCQQDSEGNNTSFGPQVDWESLFFTFVFMIDRQKMPWLWSRLGEREDRPPEFGSVRVLYSAESQKMIQAKNKLLMQCKRLWMSSERENWNLSHWRRESVDQIIDLLQRWAAWIMDDEMREPEKVEELLSSLPTH